MPRNDLKAYTTVLARIPQDLADQVKQYASQHRCTVSELIRDGLEMRLEAEMPGRSTGHSGDHGEEVLHEVLQALKALSTMEQAALPGTIRQTIAEVLHEVLPKYVSRQRGDLKGMTEVLPHNVDFDPTKFYLADLCKRGHDYQGTGKSLLRRGNANCVECQRELRRERDARRTAAAQEG